MRLRVAARGLAVLLPLLLVAAACGGGQPGASSDTITVYTCVSDNTIQPVIEQFKQAKPGREVKLYRAPTGELNARVAADVRSGGLKADVVWACDPLTMQNWVDSGLVGGWAPETDIPGRVRTPDYVGVALLYMLAITRSGVAPPAAWSDLTGQAYTGGVALPDPGTAASALGALGFFASNPDYGMDFYTALKKNGAVQVSTPDNVTTGVAQGVYRAGITIANSAYAAKKKGSPISIAWPEPGAVAIYGPIALAKETGNSDPAKDFISYVTSRAGQTVIGASGSYPTLAGVQGPTTPAQAPVVYPDWSALATQKDSLLSDYRRIFGG